MLLAAFVRSAPAVDSIDLQLGSLQGVGWSTGPVTLRLGLPAAGGVSVDLSARDIRTPSGTVPVRSVTLHCPHAELRAGGAHCGAAGLQLVTAGGTITADGADLVVERRGAETHLRVEHLRLASGRLDLDASTGSGRWQAHVHARDLSAGSVAGILGTLQAGPPVAFSAGHADLDATFSGEGGLQQVEVQAKLDDASFSDAAGAHAGEHVRLSAGGTFRKTREKGGDAWKLQARLALQSGQVYMAPLYLQAPAKPLTLEVAGAWTPSSGRLTLARFALDHPGTAEISGDGVLMLGPPPEGGLHVRRVEIAHGSVSLPGFYHTYLEPLAAGGELEDLKTAGTVKFSGEWGSGGPASADVRLDGVSVDDAQGRFGITGIAGDVRWRAQGDAGPSHLAWTSGHLYRVPFGAARVEGRARKRGFTLAQPLVLPVLDGALHVDRFEATGIGTPGARWALSGLVDPVSMKALSGALGWPAFGGSVSGVIPTVRYQGGVVDAGGALVMQVFDGFVVMRNLRLQRPLGPQPVLDADVDVNGLSLDALTRAFSFGSIQGRLEGYVHDLVLRDWKPQSFDARFETPQGDESRHRISQRAVNNLASIGGASGVSGVLSSTLLRFFDEFSYDRLGLSCRLRGGVCTMGGVAPAEQGYYIVRGGGVPRIDVIGFNREVDWDTLVQRLESVTRAESPVIK